MYALYAWLKWLNPVEPIPGVGNMVHYINNVWRTQSKPQTIWHLENEVVLKEWWCFAGVIFNGLPKH